MKNTLLILIFLIFSSTQVAAHPGRTDSSGGHNCNVGACAGTYHYHGGSAPAPAPYVAPTTQPYVQPPTTIPSPISTPVPSPLPSPTPTPSPTPEVKGEATEVPVATPEPEEVQEASAGAIVLTFGLLAAIVGGVFWVVRKVMRRFVK